MMNQLEVLCRQSMSDESHDLERRVRGPDHISLPRGNNTTSDEAILEPRLSLWIRQEAFSVLLAFTCHVIDGASRD